MFSFLKKPTKIRDFDLTDIKIVDRTTTIINIDFGCRGYSALLAFPKKNLYRGFSVFGYSTPEQFQQSYEKMLSIHTTMQKELARVYDELTISGFLKGDPMHMQFNNLNNYYQFLINNDLILQFKTSEKIF